MKTLFGIIILLLIGAMLSNTIHRYLSFLPTI